MRTSIRCILISFASFTASPAFGIVIELRPVSSTGSYTIVDNEITLPAGGVGVTLEVRVSDWGPAPLRAFQASIDSAGYTSGDGTLSPLVIPSARDGAFIDHSRMDYVFNGVDVSDGVRTAPDDYMYFGAIGQDHCRTDSGDAKYVGTLILNVSAGASGVFTVGFRPYPLSMGVVCPSVVLDEPEFIPATIRIGPGDDGDSDPCGLFVNCFDFCDLNPTLCHPVKFIDIERLGLICWHWPCRLIDFLPENCKVKWPGGCPGCGAGLCPPFYTMQFDGLDKAWTVRLLDVFGNPVPYVQTERGQSTIISFRPSREHYIEGSIGSYMLVFDLNSPKHVGKEFTIGAKLIDAGDRPKLPQK